MSARLKPDQDDHERAIRANRTHKIAKAAAIPMTAAVPEDERHRTDLGTKVKSDVVLPICIRRRSVARHLLGGVFIVGSFSIGTIRLSSAPRL
jgi:hypothetical protein